MEISDKQVERIIRWGETRKDEYDYDGSKGWTIEDAALLAKLRSHRR